jgi:hypothetical protein
MAIVNALLIFCGVYFTLCAVKTNDKDEFVGYALASSLCLAAAFYLVL